MKTSLRSLAALVASLATVVAASAAAENAPAPKEKREQLRVLTPDREPHRWLAQQRETGEKESVAFLGVETAPVSPTVSAQLSIPRGTGLVVNHVMSGSPAAGALQQYDILLRLDDQILIEVRQLAVLVRTHQEGDEVTLTYLRGGQKATAKVKLGKQEVPKLSDVLMTAPHAFAVAGDGAGRRVEPFAYAEDPEAEREHFNHVLSLIGQARGAPDAPEGAIPPPVRIQIDRQGGPGFRAMAVHTDNSNLVFTDDEGALKLTMKDGAKTLVAKNAKGEQVFSGPVTTPEERKALSASLRERLERLESMYNVTFRADGDFQGQEMKVVRPRGISLPVPARAPAAPAPRAAFF